MRKEPPNQYRRREFGSWSSTDDDMMNGAFSVPIRTGNGYLVLANCIVSNGVLPHPEKMPEPYRWEHVSVHIEDNGKQRTPSWKEMCAVKDIFWGPEECVVQFHPPESEYVNNHPNVLHLWKWTGGRVPRSAFHPGGDQRPWGDQVKEKIEALRYAISICDSKDLAFKHPAYRAACQEVNVCLEAAIERLESGEDMNATCSVQEPQSITCPKCGRTSYNPNDIKERYCGHCHRWHEDMKHEP